MVALAILGTGLFVLLEAHFASLMLFSEAQEAAEMRLFVEQAMGLAEVEVLAGETGGEGDFGERYPEYSYVYSATEAYGEEMPGLLEVMVMVNGPADERQLTFYVFDGNQVDPKTRE